MTRYFMFFLIITTISIIYFSYQMKIKDTTTMKYFPLDKELFITDAFTELTYNKEEDYIDWLSRSTSSEATYLRQDVALIYENGKFKGLQSKWVNDQATIELNNTIPVTKSALLQSISFHHGEIHHESDAITSIQKMTNDSLYIIKNKKQYHSFHDAQTKTDKLFQKKIMDNVDKKLNTQLQKMLIYLHITAEEYDIFPLHEVVIFNDSPLFNFSSDTTNQVIGQFWEGFYSEYITLLMSYKDNIPSHYMPFILIAKDKSHLLVLFELDQKQHKLIQLISAN